MAPARLVVGEPRHPDGAEHDMTLRARRFANQLHGRFNLPVELVDERYSSAVIPPSAARSSTPRPPPSFCNNTLTTMPTTTNDAFDAEALYRACSSRCAPAWPACPMPPSSASTRAAPGWPSGWPPTSA
jgi:hypothetical protein